MRYITSRYFSTHVGITLQFFRLHYNAYDNFECINIIQQIMILNDISKQHSGIFIIMPFTDRDYGNLNNRDKKSKRKIESN